MWEKQGGDVQTNQLGQGPGHTAAQYQPVQSSLQRYSSSPATAHNTSFHHPTEQKLVGKREGRKRREKTMANNTGEKKEMARINHIAHMEEMERLKHWGRQ